MIHAGFTQTQKMNCTVKNAGKKLRSQKMKRISEWKGEAEDGSVTYIDGAVHDADGLPVR